MGGFFYTTKAGDMWDYIAWMVYGSEFMVEVLYAAIENTELLETYIFESGIKVWCPYVDTNVTAEDEVPPWRDNG